MKILLRIALFMLCGAAGIIAAVQLAPAPAVENAQTEPAAVAPSSSTASTQASTMPASPAPPSLDVVASKTAAPPAVAKNPITKQSLAKTSGWPKVRRDAESSRDPSPRYALPQSRVAAQFPDSSSGGSSSSSSSGNSIVDMERRLQETMQQLNQARQHNAAVIEAAGAVGSGQLQDPGALLQQIQSLNQSGNGGVPSTNGPSQQQINQLNKMVQDAVKANAAAGPQLPVAAAADNEPLPQPAAAAAPKAAVVETLPPVPTVTAEGDGRLTIHSRDDDVRTLLEQLGEQAGLNILASESVTGTISVNLRDVGVDEALSVVLKATGYVSRREGNVVYIGTTADFAALEKSLDRITTRVYRPNYLNAKELSNLLTPLLTPGVGKLSVTSPAASGIATDNTQAGGDHLAQQDAVVIQDYEQVLAEIDQVFKELDRRPSQVSIEAVIVSVRLDDENSFGVDFQLLRDKQNVRFGWGNPGINPLNGTGAINPANGGRVGEFQFDTGGLKFAFLDDSLGVFINALETVGDANIIASPKLLCLNKQKAEILIGQRLGYISTTVTQTFSTQNVEFLDVGTQLRLRPFISSDGLIRMEVHPELSTGEVLVEGGFTLPNKTLTEVTTNVMCPDGCTVIIGGLMREELATNSTQVPFFGSLPVAGPLFRNKTESVARTEILVLLTPRIVYDADIASEGEKYRADMNNTEATKFHRMNPVGKAHMARDYLVRAEKAVANGNRVLAQRYARLAVHYDPVNREAVRLYTSLNGGATPPPLVGQGLGATVVVGEDEEIPQAIDGGPVPEWMLNELGEDGNPLPPQPPLPIHPREPGVPGQSVDIQRPEVFRNDR